MAGSTASGGVWERLMRNRSTPRSSRARMTSPRSDAGPSVQRILIFIDLTDLAARISQREQQVNTSPCGTRLPPGSGSPSVHLTGTVTGRRVPPWGCWRDHAGRERLRPVLQTPPARPWRGAATNRADHGLVICPPPPPAYFSAPP